MGKSIVLRTLICLTVMLLVASSGGCKQEPATLEYRDNLEMGIGGCEGVIFRLAKSDSWLENRVVSYTLGIWEDGEFKPLPESLEVLENWNSGVREDVEMARSQETLIRIKTSANIVPGEYELSVQMEVEEKGVIDYLPFTISVTEAADDIVETPGGPTYRAWVQSPDAETWPPVEEQTVTLGTQGVQLDYRDFVEMGIGESKGILFTLHTAGTELEEKDINYTVGLLENDALEPLPEPLEVVEMWTYDSPPHLSSPVTVIFIGTDYRMQQATEFNLGVQLEVDGVGVIGCVPLTVSVVEAADDILFPPGVAAYRTNVHGPDDKPWPPVEEKRLYLEAP